MLRLDKEESVTMPCFVLPVNRIEVGLAAEWNNGAPWG